MGKKRERNSSSAMEKIIDDRMENGTMQYKVKWVGKAEETWEDEDKIESEELIQKYLETKEDGEDGSEGDDDSEEVPAKKKKDGEGGEENEDEFEVDSLVADRTTDEEIIEEYKANKAGGGGTPNNKGKKGPATKTKGAGAKGKAEGGGGGKAKKAVASGDREPDVIVATHMLKDGKRELLVRWKNLPESEESWEPEEKLVGTPVHDNLLVREKEIRAKREAKLKEGKGAAPAAASSEE